MILPLPRWAAALGMALFLGLVPATDAAADTESGWAERVVGAYRSPAPITTDTALTLPAAIRVQERAVEALRADLGGVFGYKAGLTSEAARQRFGVDEPILGTLLTGMILEDGAGISVATGVNLLVEADLLVRVKDERINDAGTHADALAAIDRLAPFIEVPDFIIEQDQPVNGAVLTAVNSGARWGVMGAPVSVEGVTAADLAGFTVRLERGGETVADSTGSALMGHPLEVVLWMVAEARERGITLKAGDWLSLGSLTAPSPVQAGESYVATYTGLGSGPLTVGVGFTP